MSRQEFFEKAMTDLDEKYINEAAEELHKRQGEEIRITDNRTAKPQKNSGLRMFIGVAAAIALVIGGFAVLNSLSGKLPVGENPYDASETGDTVTKYDRVVISDEGGAYTEIYPEIWDEYSKLAVELIENLEKVTLTETDYIPSNGGSVEYTGINLYYDEACETYKIAYCYAGGSLDHTIITKNGVNYEASGDELIRVMEITTELMKTSVPSLLSGEYYLDGNADNGVYIEVKNGTICLKGDNDLDFVKANCGDMNYNDVYQALGEKEYIVSGNVVDLFKNPIITDWDKTQKVNANRYQGLCHYYLAGFGQNGPIIELLGHNFTLDMPEIMEYEDTFAKGTIRFTELVPVEVDSINNVQLPIGNETAAKSYFDNLSGNSTGIDRFGLTVLFDYEFDEKNSFCNAMGDSALQNDYAQLRYIRNESDRIYTGSYIDVFVGQAGSSAPELTLPTGLGLVFHTMNNENEKLSEFTLADGTVLKLKMGGAIHEGQNYYTAEWTDTARQLKYKVNAKNCTTDFFISTVIALIYDVDGIGNLTDTDSALPTNLADYTMDFQIFYDYFRGIWQDDQVGYISEIGWDDDFFNYDNPLVGFYKDSKGAYMARYSYPFYVLYFIPEDDRNSMYQYVIEINEDGTTIVPEQPGAIFTRTGKGKFSQNTGIYGYLGICELCKSEGIDFDALHNLSFDDHDGEHWSRHNDTAFNDWGDIGVLSRNSKDPSGSELVLALKFLNGDGVTEQYFLCNLMKLDDGTLRFTETPIKFDISELDIGMSQTKNAEIIKNNVVSATENGINDFYGVAEYDVYPVSDDSYYLIRRMGVNHGQWLGYVDIFWYSGEIVDYKDYEPVMYTQVEGEYDLYMGSYWLAVDNGYLYYLSGDIVKNEYYISCIYEGKEISRYDIGYLDYAWFEGITHDKDGYTDIVFGSDRKWQYRVDYSDPYNPQFVGITNLTDPENQATLYGDYRFVHDVGNKLDKSDYKQAGESESGYELLMDEIYLIEASEAENLLLKPYQTLVFTITDKKGYQHTKDDFASFSYHSDGSVNHLTVGYIKDGVAYEIFSGQTNEKWKNFELNSLPTGEYQMYITNYSGYLQYYDFIGIAVT